MNPAFHALINLAIGLLIAGFSIPLIRRKVAMNKTYGIRFRESFLSDEAWYRINAFGGKCLLAASVPMLLVGIYGLIDPPSFYVPLGSGVLMISLLLACLVSYAHAKRVGRELG